MLFPGRWVPASAQPRGKHHSRRCPKCSCALMMGRGMGLIKSSGDEGQLSLHHFHKPPSRSRRALLPRGWGHAFIKLILFANYVSFWLQRGTQIPIRQPAVVLSHCPGWVGCCWCRELPHRMGCAGTEPRGVWGEFGDRRVFMTFSFFIFFIALTVMARECLEGI